MELFQAVTAIATILIIGYAIRVILAISRHVQPGAIFSTKAHTIYEISKYLHWFLLGLSLLIIGLLGMHV